MVSVNCLFYAAATFLLAEIASAMVSPLAAIGLNEWQTYYQLTTYLVWVGPVVFIVLAIIGVGVDRDRATTRQDP